MKQPFKNMHFKAMLQYFLLAVLVILAYKIIEQIDIAFKLSAQLLSTISPFIYGFFMAYILNIPCGGIQKLLMKTNNSFVCKRSKVLSILITYMLVCLTLILILRLVIPYIYNSIGFFVENYQTYYNSAQELIDYINDLDSESNLDVINIDFSVDKAMLAIRDFGLKKLPESVTALFGVSSTLFKGFLAVISSIYVLFEKNKFENYLRRLLMAFTPETFCEILFRYAGDLNKNCKQYIYTQTIDGCILGTIATVELYLIGSPYAVILGIMLGIVNYIPYFGSIFGSIVAVFIVAITQDVSTAGLAACILLITQQIDGNVIQPKLMGASFSISPLLIIISITVGGSFYGIFGMLAAIPIVVSIKKILEEIIVYYEQRK